MRFAGQRKPRAQVINVTSLIDVIFLLVIFVLVTAKYDTEGGIAVDLPRGKLQEAPGARRVFNLTVMHDGSIFLEKEKVLMGELAGRIKDIRAHSRDPVMIIRTDRDAPAGRVILVTEVAREAGQRKLNFKTKR